MKKIVVLSAIALFSSISFGQNTTAEAVALTQKMAVDLNLTAEQTQQISDINIGIAGKNNNVNTNTTYTAEQRAEILKFNKDAQEAMIRNVLTPEQIKLWESKPQIKKIEYKEEGAPKTLEQN